MTLDNAAKKSKMYAREGGLRSRGEHKSFEANKPVISVITVVYNGEENTELTIESVVNQSYFNTEYIIIDGGSTDGTVEILEKYDNEIDYWISENDDGIFDAMNKGIDLATGNWLIFMNSGDRILNKITLEMISHKLKCPNKIYYGKWIVDYPKKQILRTPGSIENLWKGSQICHQSAFIPHQLHRVHRYDACLRLSADYKFFLQAYHSGVGFEYVNEIICKYMSGGISDQLRVDSLLEYWMANTKTTRVCLHYITRIIREILRSQLLKIVGR